MNKKYLAGIMGGLTMMGAMGLNTSARDETQSTVKTKSETSFLNKIDKTTMGIVGGSLAVGGIFVEALNLMFRKPKIEYRDKIIEKEKIVEKIVKDQDFALNEKQKNIYDKTKILSGVILAYAEEYVHEKDEMPDEKLEPSNPEHQEILRLISSIREDWLNMYEPKENKKLTDKQRGEVLINKNVWTSQVCIWSVTITENAIASLFYGLPVGETTMSGSCTPESLRGNKAELDFLILLSELEHDYRSEFLTMKRSLKQYQLFMTYY